MSKVRLTGTTSGFTELTAPAVAGSNTITLPSGNGSANQLLKNGATAGSLEFASNVVIDSSNNVGIGTTSPQQLLHVNSSGGTGGQLQITNASTGATSTDGLLVGYNASNDVIFNNQEATQIKFFTSGLERAAITSDGTVHIGTSTNLDQTTNGSGFNYIPGNFLCVAVASPGNACAILNKSNNNAGLVVSIRYNGAQVGSIVNTSTTTAYNTSSDYRLKENVTPVPNGITRLLQLKPSRFNFIADPDTVVDGFIAHEAQAVVPECVTGEKDEVDEDGNPVMQGIDQSKLVPLLTAALQEALQQIEALTARVTALEAN